MILDQTINENHFDDNLFQMFTMNDNHDFESVLSTFEKLIQRRLPLVPYNFPFEGSPCDWEKSINESLSSCSSSQNSHKKQKEVTEKVKTGLDMNTKKTSLFKVHHKQEDDGKFRVNLRSECIRKRIKSKFHGYILNKLNDFVKCESKDVFFLNSPKKMRVSVNLRLNQRWMSMALKDAYTDLSATSSASERKSVEQNSHSFQKVKQPRFIEFINTSLKDLYLCFYESTEFQVCVNELKRSRGEKYINRFLKVSKEFPNYYSLHSV